MPIIQTIADFLERFAPTMLAEEWDNVGLLVGHMDRPVQRVMTCLTITPESAEEAVAREADLIISHHPLPFRATKRLTADDTAGRLLLQLIERKVAIYSPHTAFDSAAHGINQQLAEALELQEISPLVAIADAPPGTGSGRLGKCVAATPVSELATRLKAFLRIPQIQLVGDAELAVRYVAVACGAAGQFLKSAADAECQLLILGETNFHTCLEARARGMALLLTGHFASERFGVESLADQLRRRFPELTVWVSEAESDPLQSL